MIALFMDQSPKAHICTRGMVLINLLPYHLLILFWWKGGFLLCFDMFVRDGSYKHCVTVLKVSSSDSLKSKL